MSDLIKWVSEHDKLLGLIGGATSGGVAVAKSIYDLIQSRSSDVLREKLLREIQGLRIARDEANAIGTPANSQYLDSLNRQLSQAVAKLAKVEFVVEEKKGVDELGWFRRAFLFFKPATIWGWVAHVVCWFCLLVLVVSPFDLDLKADFRSISDYYIFFVFYIGVFLLSRQWGISERRKYLRKRSTEAASTTDVIVGAVRAERTFYVFPMVMAGLYALVGLGSVVGAVVNTVSDPKDPAIKLGAFGVIVLGCAVTLYFWSRLRGKGSLTNIRSVLLFVAPFLLALVIVFDIGGIVVKEFGDHPLAYWRNWIQQPFVPLIFLPFAALPLYASIRCIMRAAQGV